MTAVFLLAVLVVCANWSSVYATSDDDWTLEDEYRLGKGNGYGPDPNGVPLDFRCAWRKLALDYARQLRPDSVPNVHDALLLGSMCNVSLSEADKSVVPVFPPREWPAKWFDDGVTQYVDAVNGDDSHSGTTPDSPKKTIHAALAATRQAGPGSKIVLRKGTFYLPTPLELTPADSTLIISNYPGEEVWVSGAHLLNNLQWKSHDVTKGMNVYVADVADAEGIAFTGLRVNGRRVTRARRPNSDPERDFFPKGWFPSSTAAKWLPAHEYGPAKEVQLGPVRNITGMFEMYGVGIGGPCSQFSPPVSYWCQKHPPGGFQYYVPSGMTFKGKEVFDARYGPVNGPWKNITGAVAHVWRSGHWSSWMFDVDAYSPDQDTLHWTRGGFQGARGGRGSDWFIENVFQELDAPGEWFFNRDTSQLFYFHNASSGTAPPADLQVEATNLQVLINITGTQANPVKNVTISGIGFCDAAYTYLSPHGVPSGGDWGLERLGALFFQGTENCVVNSSILHRMDGNGIMLSGYNQHTVLSNNNFSWTGSTAMAAWGITDEISDEGKHGNDGTDGNFPRYTMILNNVVRETGIWEKQSSGWFQAKSAQSVLRGNIIYNLARAAVNINDGFGGGNDITENLIFNTCRESSDHGPINSWDRQPFLTTVNGGTAGVIPLVNEIHNNFLVSNYGGTKGGVDNDDGSILYANHDNFEIYGWGQKNGIGCGDHRSYNNVHLYLTTGYLGHTNFFGYEQYADQVYNETWLFGNGTTSYIKAGAGCSLAAVSKTFIAPNCHDNTVYDATASEPKVTCGKDSLTISEWQEKTGLDKGTTVSQQLPSNDELMNMGRRLLDMTPQ
ncbi:uncharacterized protein LOC135808331 [Sycon ciliatum]|uniref:uncharacterized protein LOC135808331 n=1 Tax=Sycon ciliatum TaxID=27933 RepID=UPI0031F70394